MDKSPGTDGIYRRLLGEAREEIAGALMRIFGFFLPTSEAPQDWRVVNVVPLLKKGSNTNTGNNRLASPMLVVGKLLVRILRDTIYSHLEANLR